MPADAKPAAGAVTQGILLMTASSLVIAIQDALVKWLSAYPIAEIVFLRALFTFVPAAYFVWRAGGLSLLKTRRARAQVARGLWMIVSMFFYIGSLRLLPLADALTLNFASPLFVTALATPFLGERVGWRRWSAVLLGFAGVAVMLRPTEAALNWAVLLGAASALCTAIRDVLTRRMTTSEHPAAILFYTNVVLALAPLPTLPFGFEPMGAFDLALVAAMGLLVGLGEYFGIQAIRLAEVAITMPFRYTAVPWAALIGFLVWGDVPDRFMVVGAALVIGSGLYILKREMRLARTRTPAT